MKRLGIFFLMVVLFSSCMKEDNAITLPAPGPVKQGTANMGVNYDNQVYYNLETGATIVRPYKAYDLAFEASKTGFHIYLNSAKFMFACNTQSYNMANADTVGHAWALDCEQLLDDTLALTKYWQDANFSSQGSKVFAIDRGKLEHTGAARWRKLKVLSVDSLKYTICFSNYDNSGMDTVEVVKDENYSLMYFSFDTPNQLIQQAPPKDQWDFVFTKYTHVFFEYDVTSPFRYYFVSGVIQNSWNNTEVMRFQKDSMPTNVSYLPIEQFNYSQVQNYTFSNNANTIGYNWKYYNFSDAHYHIYPDLYFVVKANNGFYYTVKMVDFYDTSGNKGFVTFQTQRI
ncbi:MAG: HmuY family protein [Bacteroidota bacterium]